MTIELKPCPFCGGKCDPYEWLGEDGRHGPGCKDCGATACTNKKWNTRTESEEN